MSTGFKIVIATLSCLVVVGVLAFLGSSKVGLHKVRDFRFAPPRTLNAPLTKLTEKIDPYCYFLVRDLSDYIEAGLGLNVLTGEIFWEKSPDKPCPIASLTKLMVVLIAMEKIESGELSLADIITVTAEASKIGGSQVYLKEGEKFPVGELLKAMLICSANDASYLVAQYIGGSEKNFVKLMNERAWDMGLRHTYFSNSTGLPPFNNEYDNVSSCMDIARLVLQVIKYPEVREWASTEVDYFRNGKFELRTWNTLMRNYDAVDGLKTGYYREAGWCIVATSLRGSQKVMVIVLGGRSRSVRDRVAKRLIRYVLNKQSGL